MNFHRNTELLAISLCVKSEEGFDLVSSKLVESDFYFIECRVMFAAVCKLRSENREVDGAVLAANVIHDPRFIQCQFDDEFGESHESICLLMDELSSVHTKHAEYVEEIIANSISRSLLTVCGSISDIAGSNISSDEKLSKASEALSVVSERIQPDTLPTMQEIIKGSLDEFMAAKESGKGLRGISTGYKQIDLALSGLINGELYIIAAKSGAGKTTLALNMAQNISKTHKVKFFSLEMPATQLVTRMACRALSLPLAPVMNGTTTDNQEENLSAGFMSLMELKLQIDDRASVTIEQFASRARIAKAKEGCDLIVVDYLQLLQCHGQQNRTMEITRISNSLKAIAKELDIPIIALSQLNRDNEKRADRRHVMSDLKESSTIEHDACAVLFIYIPSMYEKDIEECDVKNVEIDIAKNRHGRKGKHWIVEDLEHAQFKDWGDKPYPKANSGKSEALKKAQASWS